MNADGSGQTRLTSTPLVNEFASSWSPDGAKIAYDTAGSSNSDIWLMNADGTGQTALVTGPASDHSPNWSPDGTKIAFTSDWRVAVVPAAGGTPTLVTTRGGRPDWSPDGTKIAFEANNPAPSGSEDIYVVDATAVNADPATLTNLTNATGQDLDVDWARAVAAPPPSPPAATTTTSAPTFRSALVGAAVRDSVTVTGGSTTPGGSVSFFACGPLVEPV